MTTCDRECEACPHWSDCDMQAAVEYRAEVEAEVVASMPTPVQIASCDCHADHELRLCTLEDLVSRMRREMARGVEL